MRAFVGVVLGALVLGSTLGGSETISQAVNLEKRGEAAEARTLLQRAARNPAADAETLTAYAEFLDRYHDPETRPAYEKALAALESAGSPEKRSAIARRLVL